MNPLFPKRSLTTLVVMLSVLTLTVVGYASIAEAKFKVTPSLIGAFTNDSRITSVALSSASSVLGATTTWTVNFTTNTAIASGSRLMISFRSSCFEQACKPTTTSTTVSGISATSSFDPGGNLNLDLTSNLSAGNKTLTLSSVKNPTQSTAMKAAMSSFLAGAPPPSGQPNETPSAAVIFGSVAVYGTITMPDGVTPVPYTGVSMRNADFSVQTNGSTDQDGFFAMNVPTTGMPNGTYAVQVFPPQGTTGVVAPAPKEFSYSGAPTAIGTIKMDAATKTLKVTVLYSNGSPVTTASVWTNNRSGGGFGGGSDVDASGKATLSLGAGTYDVGIGPKWDQTTNQQASVDWIYNQPPTTVEFAGSGVETKELTFSVNKATAVIKGVIQSPEGTALANVRVDCNSGFGPGNGTNTNATGAFSISVTAGEYNCNVWLDPSNATYAQYAAPEMRATVADGQTIDLGTTKLVKKEAKITGKVTGPSGEAIKDFRLNAFPTGSFGWNEAKTAADGTYTMYLKGPGKFHVEIDRSQSTYLYDGQPIEVDLSSATASATVNFSLKKPNATVTVKTVDKDGKALSNMFGFAECTKADAPHGPGNFFGAPINQGVATISLVISASTNLNCGMFVDPQMGLVLKERKNVSVNIGESKSVTLTLLTPDATVNLTIIDQSGVAITGAAGAIEVFLMQVRSGSADFGSFTPARIDANGKASMKIAGGKDYSVGYWIRPDSAIVSQFLNSPPEIATFNVALNSTVARAVSIFRSDTSVSGKLLDPDGNLTSGFVYCSNRRSIENKLKGQFEGGKVIDSGTEVRSGTFSVPLVSGGEYDCGAGVPHFLSGKNNFMPPEQLTVLPTKATPVTGVVLQFGKADYTVNTTGTLDNGSKPLFGWCHAFSPDGGNSGGELFNGSGSVPLTSGKTWFIGCDSHDPDSGKFWRSEEQQLTTTGPGSISLSFVLEESSFTIPPSVTDTFDATTSRTLTMPDGTRLDIPSSALATSGNVTVTMEPQINLFATIDDQPVWYGYNISASTNGQSITGNFNSPITLTVPAPSDEQLEEFGIDEADIIPKVYDETNNVWKDVDGSSYDSTNNLYTVSLTHLTNVALNSGSSILSASTGPANILATPWSKGGPQVTIWDKDGKVVSNFFAFDSKLRVGLTALGGDIDNDGNTDVVVVPGPGAGPQVRVFTTDGKLVSQFFAFAKHLRTGLNLAIGDVDGDGDDDIVVSPNAGAGPQVRVFDIEGNVLLQFFAYDSKFRGGVSPVLGDVDGDGDKEIITAPESNAGPQIRVFGGDGKLVSQFFAYDKGVRGGFRATAGDVDGDGDEDMVIATRSGHGPQLTIVDGTGKVIHRFFAFAKGFRGGVNVAVGDVTGDGSNDIVVLPASAAGSQVRVFDKDGNVLSQFFAYDKGLRGTYSSFVDDVTGDGIAEIVTAPGPGMGPQVRVFDQDGSVLSQFFTHHKGFRGGLNIAPVR